MIRGVFFDFDGTLFDTESDILSAYHQVFRELGIEADMSRFRVGPPLKECIRSVRPEIGEDALEKASARFRELYDASNFPETRPYPGVEEMLSELARGRKIFIVTNKRIVPTRLILEKYGWIARFAGIYTGDCDPVCRRSKTENLLLAMAQNDLVPEACLMAGDTRPDVDAGHAAGMRAVGVSWGYDADGELAGSHPERIVGSPAEFLQYTEAL